MIGPEVDAAAPQSEAGRFFCQKGAILRKRYQEQRYLTPSRHLQRKSLIALCS